MKKVFLIVFSVLFIDQFVKIWIKTHFHLGEEFPVINNFFYIHFTENYGMAFGIEIEGEYGKLFLSIFRILAVCGIGWYLHILIKSAKADPSSMPEAGRPLATGGQKSHSGLLFCMSLILAGAIGNILDSAFYGLLFSESTVIEPSVFFPAEGGYAGFLHGAVVDMFYFYSHHDSTFWSNEPFTFSFPIFNISDSAITIGVIIILVFQKLFFKKHPTAPVPKE